MIKFCGLFSGSSGNAIYIKCKNTCVLIDAGVSGTSIIGALQAIGEDPSKISAILITHEHSDHTKGAGILSRKFNIPVYANANTWNAMAGSLGKIDLKNIRCFSTGKELNINDICVKPFKTPHDAAESVGFSVFAGNKKITVATDMGFIFEGLLDELEGSDVVLIESNHDVEMLKTGPYPWPLKKRVLGENGHLSNDMAGEVVMQLGKRGTGRFLLGHLSEQNNFPELAYQTVINILQENGFHVGKDILLNVLPRNCPGEVINL